MDDRSGPRWQVRVLAPDGGVFAIPLSDPCTVGRAPDNGLVLSAVEVSRHHATLRIVAAGVEVEDHGSGNGVHVGGRRVERAVLLPGQAFEIRPYVLEVARLDPEDAASPTTRIAPEGPRFVLRSCTVDLEAALVRAADGDRPLTATEVALLAYLGRAGRVVPKEELLAEVWGYHPNVQSRTVDTTIYRLRMKIERDPREPDHLLTVRGEGYRLVVDPP